MAFDETAIVTWANMVTVGRVLASPFLFMLIPDDGRGSYVALIVWIVLCSSDGFDGYLARKHGITRSGAFLDCIEFLWAQKVSQCLLAKPQR